MIINDIQFNADLSEILGELQRQLILNNIPLLRYTRDTPDNIMVQCPYHKGGQERRPSAGISKRDGTFHCFGCGEVHSLQEVISYCFSYNEPGGMWGWNWLLKNFLTVAIEERKDVVLDFGHRGNDKVCIDTHSSALPVYISEQELDSYRYYHPYMYKRKLTNDIIELFDIGYDENTDCITFPVRDINGNTLFVARRSVQTKFFNYPQGVEKPVYGLYELREVARRGTITGQLDINGKKGAVLVNHDYPNEIIICESMIDGLTCWVYGKYAVALNGLGNELQFKQLNQMPCRKFILATDMDSAGQKARDRLRKALKNKIITEYVWDVNIAKDINDMSKEYFNQLQEVF